MKRDRKRIILSIVILIWAVIAWGRIIIMVVSAEPVYTEPVKMRVTCYLPTGNKTADGTVPYEGICAARRQDLGKVAVVYDMDMQLIGFFEVRDTGGHERLKNGTSIDIFRDNMDRAKEWIATYGDYCYVQLIEADG